ncbi:hypothetical protein OIU85_012883 [Salix viminalis]|uniref:TFIID subunit TAF5 NTD2 domain-containing protein n=1 Tax=Salix viminalis TaxID=40686 RepID=A0A9Q0NQ92_SALVM|nr:hypothetical protein OIU85_012883 [Salix viminalis]
MYAINPHYDSKIDCLKVKILRKNLKGEHDIVAKGQIQEGRSFFNSFREDHEMMHSQDLQKLEGVLSPSHLEAE